MLNTPLVDKYAFASLLGPLPLTEESAGDWAVGKVVILLTDTQTGAIAVGTVAKIQVQVTQNDDTQTGEPDVTLAFKKAYFS